MSCGRSAGASPELRVAKMCARSRRDVADIAAAPIEVDRIDQDAGIVTRGGRDHARALGERFDVGPRHRLEIGGDAVLSGQVAKRGKALGQPGLVRIVARDKRLAGAEASASLERGPVIRNDSIRPQTEHLDVEYAHTSVDDSPRGFAYEWCVADDRMLNFLGSRGKKPQADAIESRVRRAGHHIRRRELEHRQRGEADWMRHDYGSPRSVIGDSFTTVHWYRINGAITESITGVRRSRRG